MDGYYQCINQLSTDRKGKRGFQGGHILYIGVFYDADGDNPASFRDGRRKQPTCRGLVETKPEGIRA